MVIYYYQNKARIDIKNRLTIPPEIVRREKIIDEQEVFLSQRGCDGCLMIAFKKPIKKTGQQYLAIKVRTSKQGRFTVFRVTIPEHVKKKSNSFYLGNSVWLKFLNGVLLVEPYPEK